MPGLTPEILFDIAKHLVEDNDCEAIIKFALSGKEALKAMQNVFASVTTLKLFADRFVIGWDKWYSVFELEKDIPQFLINCIGDSVENLRLDDNMAEYEVVVNKILAKKQLVTFSCYVFDFRTAMFLEEFVPQFASTLKHVTIRNYGTSFSLDRSMHPEALKSLNLESLTVLNPEEGFDFDNFCCTTSALELGGGGLREFEVWAADHYGSVSPYLSSIKKITFIEKFVWLSPELFSKTAKYFPSLELIKFIIPMDEEEEEEEIESFVIEDAVSAISRSIKVPPKITYSFRDSNGNLIYQDLDTYKLICKDFEFIESVSEFYCFRRMVKSAGSESTLFEVQIPK